MRCYNCGCDNKDEADYCAVCGSPFNNSGNNNGEADQVSEKIANTESVVKNHSKIVIIILLVTILAIIAVTVGFIINNPKPSESFDSKIPMISTTESTSTESTSTENSITESTTTKSTVTEPTIYDLDNHEPFYGVLYSAYKDRASAQQDVEKLKIEGFSDAEVIVTTDWSNFNSEKWYVVIVGRYYSEIAAQAELNVVQEVRNDAYVKYSGEWIGD